MNPLFPRARSSWPTDPEKIVHIDPRREVQEARRRWETRAAQWRARDLAEVIFGAEIDVRLQRGAGAFRGLLHMEVPFHDLDVHRHREALFRAAASIDPLLARVPFVYLFEPAVAKTPDRASKVAPERLREERSPSSTGRGSDRGADA